MLLGSDDLAALLSSLEDDLLVQGLDGVDVDDPGVDTLGSQLLGGHACLVDHQAGGDDGNIVALGQLLALAQLKVVVGLIVEHRHSQTAEAQIDGAFHGVGGAHSGACLDIVGGADDGHAGDAAHQGKVLAALVGSAVLTHGDAAVGGADLHVQVGVAHRVAHLLEGAAGCKHGKAGNKGHIAHSGQTCGHAYHVALGDAAVKVTVRVCLLEHTGLGSGGQIGVQHHQIIVAFRSQFLQGVAVAVAGRDLFHVCHLSSPPVPARHRRRSARSWPPDTLHRWGPCRAMQRNWSYRKRRCP